MNVEQSWEYPDSVPGNRCWGARVLVEGVGLVGIITCRSWQGERQAAHYSTLLMWDKPLREPKVGPDGILNDYVSEVVHHYKDEANAEIGHKLWFDAETVAATLNAIRRGVWETVGKAYAA